MSAAVSGQARAGCRPPGPARLKAAALAELATLLALMLTLVLTLIPTKAQAGRTCEATPQAPAEVVRGMALALRTAQALDASGAQVLLLARAGADLSANGLRWSHMGFVYREADPASTSAANATGTTATSPGSAPVWRVVHKLNHCGSAEAALYRQGLGEFFLDRPARYEAAFIALAPELQARLLPLLRDNDRLTQLDEPRYSMLAYPWSTRYQQSNQWLTETLAMAALESSPTADKVADTAAGLGPGVGRALVSRAQAQAWLQDRGYAPSVLHIGAMQRLGARLSAANIAFDDHPDDKRWSDRIETTTVDSVFSWVRRAGLSVRPGAPVVRVP